VTPFALSALKYGLFALLFLFVWRSMRWVIRGLTVEAGTGRRRGKPKASAAEEQPVAQTLLIHPPGGARPSTAKLTASMTIGRGADCELRLDDTYASNQHARLFGRNGSWYVEDLGSTNGTFVNDQKLAAPAQIQPGDKIRVGTTVMELRR
jgi:pSer/pThr/pTyr-binding forkhead associated (FHA) protein